MTGAGLRLNTAAARSLLSSDLAAACVQVKRCNEMSRRLRFFHEQVTGTGIVMDPAMVDIGTDLDELEVCASSLCRLGRSAPCPCP